jgi:hypothetical protein
MGQPVFSVFGVFLFPPQAGVEDVVLQMDVLK